jgi:hypothetical protein
MGCKCTDAYAASRKVTKNYIVYDFATNTQVAVFDTLGEAKNFAVKHNGYGIRSIDV